MNKASDYQTVCVLDASTFVGFWLLKKLLIKGYRVHAAVTTTGGKEVMKSIRGLERTNSGLKVFTVDTLDYHSIVEALKHCSGLFCCLDSPDKYDARVVDLEVRGTINVVEACAQIETIEKIVFTSSLTAAVWNPNISSQKDVDVDERSWSDPELCTQLKLWYALAKTQSERAAWALAMDRMVDMVSINAGLVVGPDVGQHVSSMSYLQGAEQMYENGVLASADVELVADVHIKALEHSCTNGRYFCFDHILDSQAKALQLARSFFTPFISSSSCQEDDEIIHSGRLRNNKLSKLIEA